MKNISDTLSELAAVLDEAADIGIIKAYSLIGGLAVSTRGRPRATNDIDFMILSSTTDLKPLKKYFDQKKYDCVLFKGDAHDPLPGVLRIYSEERLEIADIIPTNSKWQDEMVMASEKVEFGGNHSVPVLLAEDLIILKLKAGGTQDILDVEMLLQTNKQLDENRLMIMASRSGTKKSLEKIRKKLTAK